MRTSIRFLIVLLILGLLFGGIFGYKFYQFGQMQEQFSQPQPPAVVSATKASEESWTQMIKSTGDLRAINGIQVANEVPGIISEIRFESGDAVSRGDVLVTLDSETDQAALNTRRAEARLAQQEFNRVSDLLPKRAISQSQYDEAKANLTSAQARVNEAEASFNKKVIKAPFAGQLGLRLVDQGEYLATGTPIVEINMLDPIYADFTLSEKDLTRVKQGYTVKVSVAAMPDREFEGSIAAISSSVDTETRTVRVRASVPNPEKLLKPGMFASVQTLEPTPKQVVTVPRTAVAYNTYGDFVFAIVENDEGKQVVERRSVETGSVRNGRVAILSGLKAGEQIVSTGLLRLRAGQPVKIQESKDNGQSSSGNAAGMEG